MGRDKRFKKVYSQNMGCTMILVDSETGVNYLYVSDGGGGGVTPLLDREGKVVVTPVSHTVKGPEL
ncbi:MAG: DUF6440 family protein [Eubacteriales bacterium]|nr:DUF6440 family protein [Eubacteriales bacterium]